MNFSDKQQCTYHMNIMLSRKKLQKDIFSKIYLYEVLKHAKLSVTFRNYTLYKLSIKKSED